MNTIEQGEWSYAPDITLRQTRVSDMPRLQQIFASARNFMRGSGNPNQWSDDYPSVELLQSDIESGDSYVVIYQGRVVATFVLRGGIDPTYNVIYGGAWLNDMPYGTIHRIASGGELKGVFAIAMSFAEQMYTSIRIDTHRDNRVMQHILEQNGFTYCGVIHCWNGDERLAFQFCR